MPSELKKKVELIVLGHRKNVGKDTLANYLSTQEGFRKISFASKLKEICRDLYGLSFEQVEDTEEKEKKLERYNLTPRQILQHFGTDAVRNNVWQKTWTDYVFRKELPELIKHGETKFVITDCRFLNETEEAISFCFRHEVRLTFIEVKRGDPVLRKEVHISESELDNWNMWDFTIENNDDPLKLHADFLEKYYMKNHDLK